MQIKIRNFGPINKFDYNLTKDFVVIFGKNNIGKSYAINIIYLVIKTILNIKNQLTTSNNEELQHKFITEFQHAFSASFDKVENVRSRFSQQPISLSISTDTGEFSLDFQDQELRVNNINYLRELSLLEVKQVFYLPAARFGIYQALSAFAAIFAELSQNRNMLQQKVEIPSFSVPVSDYFLGLSNIKNNNTSGNSEILNIVAEIEQNILKGEVRFDTFLKKIFYKPMDTDLDLELSVTSSMVSELAPIICYLKYIVSHASSKSIIFIEEPEAHLHPESQVKLIKILSKLINANIKLVITSHSDYMLNQINNLIIERQIDSSKISAIIFKQKDNGSLAKQLAIDDFGIEDENFLETAEKIYQKKIELIDKLNEAA